MGLFSGFKRLLGLENTGTYRSALYNPNRGDDFIKMMNSVFDDNIQPVPEPSYTDYSGGKYKNTLEEMRQYILKTRGIDINEIPLDNSKLYSNEDLEKISKQRKNKIEKTGFNKDNFPPDTELLFFDVIFNDLYTSTDDYYDNRENFASNIQDYLSQKSDENHPFAVKIGGNEYLLFTPNTVENDAEDFNIALVDKNNNIIENIVYEQDGRTIGDSSKLSYILDAEITFLDLDEQNTRKNIGKINLSFLNKNISIQEKNKYKNEILLKLYSTHKYDSAQLDVLRDALDKGLNINYFSSPLLAPAQMYFLAQEVEERSFDSNFLKNLETFNLYILPEYNLKLVDNEFTYFYSCIDCNDLEEISSPEGKAKRKLEFLKQKAQQSNGKTEKSIAGRDFIITNNEEYEDLFDFKIEEVVIENGNKVIKPIYESKDGVETGDLNEFLNVYTTKYSIGKNKNILDDTIRIVKTAIADYNNHEEDSQILHLDNGKDILIQGIMLQQSLVSQMFAMSPQESLSSENTGIEIYVLDNGKKELLYSDSPEKTTPSLEEAIDNIIYMGQIQEEKVIKNTGFVFDAPDEEQTIDSVIQNKAPQSEAEKAVQGIIDKATLTQKQFTKKISDSLSLDFVPYKIEAENKIFTGCNVYLNDDGSQKDLFVTTVHDTNNPFESVVGSFDDVVDIYQKYKNEIEVFDSSSYINGSKLVFEIDF